MKTRPDQKNIESNVLSIVHGLLIESGGEGGLSLLNPEASFERELGLGSLERVELLLRIEAAFDVSLPDDTIAEAETPRDLAIIVSDAKPTLSPSLNKRLPSLEGISLPKQSPRTLCEALNRHAESHPDRPHLYLPSEQGEDQCITYGGLLKGAENIAAGLKSQGLLRGETVAIMLPTDERFFFTFLGVLIAGGIPAPVYPPFRPDQIEAYAKRQTRILLNAEAVFLITFQKVERLARLLRPGLPALRLVTTPEALTLETAKHSEIDLSRAQDPALIQYTSGSTGDPKGVLLSHQNLLSNIQGLQTAMAMTPEDVGVSWLPLYHDMGLIGAWLLPLVFGIPIAILPPFTFLSRPERWLWTIHKYRGSISPAPNFAYEICAGKIRDEAIEGLNLSSWRIALNGAEPIKPETLKRFTERFAPYGFRSETHLPVYGMAEASVGLAFSKLDSAPRIDRVLRSPFEAEGRAICAYDSESNPLEFVSCGSPLSEHEIRIVDDEGKPVAERIQGHLHFRGPSCTSGYYRNPKANASLFQDGWLVSGDLAYFAEGELFITGRKKDLIIKGGRNLHPHEIETFVAQIKGIRKGCVAVVGHIDPKLGTEQLIVIAETRESGVEARSKLVMAINSALIEFIGIPSDRICLSPAGSIPKTSSGKIARSACRDAYLAGHLTKQKSRMEIQLFRLSSSWLRQWTWRGIKQVGHLSYGLYLLLLSPVFILVWMLVVLLPSKYAGVMTRKGAQIFLKCAGLFPEVIGLNYLMRQAPIVWVANHASYADVLFLIAVMPAGLRFVAKQELLKAPLLRTFLKIGGHLTIDRSDVTQGNTHTDAVSDILKAGRSVLIFPEGTFVKNAGLRPFKLGAFKAAVETGSPISTIALNGTRQLLPAEQWLPRRRQVTLTIGEVIFPKENAWREIVRLRDLCRKKIALHCGEEIAD